MGLFSSIGKVFKSVAKPIIGAVTGGASSLLGAIPGLGDAFSAFAPAAASAYGAYATAQGAREANEEARRAAATQMAFQETSYKNRYTWQAEDLDRAGLNPILAYQTGAGSALPGASYTPQNELAGVPASVNSAFTNRAVQLGFAQTKASTNQTRAQTGVTKAQVGLTKNQSDRVATQSMVDQAQADQIDMETLKKAAEIDILRQNVHGAKAAATIAKQDNAFYQSKKGQVLRSIGRTGRELNPFTQAGSSARSIIR